MDTVYPYTGLHGYSISTVIHAQLNWLFGDQSWKNSPFSPNSPLEFGILDLQNLGRPTVQGLKTQMSLYTFKRAMMHYVCKPGI